MPDAQSQSAAAPRLFTVIPPTPGRVVWYTPPTRNDPRIDKEKPEAAIVAYVFFDRQVNLVVFDQHGFPRARQGVVLVQDGDPRPADGDYCEWMPYQKGQAAKTEAVEKLLGVPDQRTQS